MTEETHKEASEKTTEKPAGWQGLSVPGAIILAGVIIAGAILLTGNSAVPSGLEAASPKARGLEKFAPVNASDHILGNPDAEVVVVEYSDLECPFCKQFHQTMKQVMAEYGNDGSVAWVYRHFPLTNIHPKAQIEAEGAECAADLGGETAFWKYTDRIFEITPSNNGLDLALLPAVAEEIGLSRPAFEECLSSGRHTEAVERDLRSGIEAGVRGTPASIVVTKGGEMIPVTGAQKFDYMKGVIDDALGR